MNDARAAPRLSFAARLTLTLALLLLAYGALVVRIGRTLANEHEQEVQQRLSRGLAQHIVAHWPQIAPTPGDADDAAVRAELMGMLMTVNPAVQVYVLDADGRVQHYIGEPGMVRTPQVDLAAVRAFLSGAALPLRGTDPMGTGVPRIFSAAMFAARPGALRPPGYLYVVLDGRARDAVAGDIGASREWRGALAAAGIGLVVTVLVGGFTFRRLTLPLHRLAARLGDYSVRDGEALTAAPPPARGGDEVRRIEQAFAVMTQRIALQAERERRQLAAHRELMASVAHDLRTPLTALHGHLESLSSGSARLRDLQPQLVAAALAQSRKVVRLSQQLFEIAALQATDEVLHREPFLLDELLTDAVRKFDLSDPAPRVALAGAPPGRLEIDGDPQLIERALTNLVDNALRHSPGHTPVTVSARRAGMQVEIWVEDGGPGLPVEVRERLEAGQSLRDPPLQRRGGGIGGLGLAIAQRVAVLHGGSLCPLPAPNGGTRLCLSLPLAA